MRRSRFSWDIAAAMLTLMVAGIPNPAEAGQARTHDGLFLRLSAGVGYASTEIDFGTDRLKLSGGAGDANFAIGGTIGNNLILHGTLAGWAISDPDVETDEFSLERRDASVNVGGIGPGVTWYSMPANLYLSGSILLSTVTLDTNIGDYDSDVGVALDLTVGKEWWVGRNWGLGIAGGVNLHSIPDDGSDEKFSGSSFAVRFSATMN